MGKGLGEPQIWLGAGLGIATGYVLAQQAWALAQLLRVDVQETLATHGGDIGPAWPTYEATQETAAYTVRHTIDGGIERIVYRPRQPRFATPILMQHGMFQGAWCWASWQALFATWGWESHAYSLPGHAGSPRRRPIARCTLDYYLAFLKAEAERLPQQPVLMGHSMGGGLVQWYLKYVGDVPAAVLVTPMVAHSMAQAGLARLLMLDPLGVLGVLLRWTATPMVRTPRRAARAFLGPKATYDPETLHARLGPESMLVLYQHNPPFWFPPHAVHTPMLWLAAADDTLIGEAAQRRSAAFYDADYVVVPEAGHGVMLEHNAAQTARTIHTWLKEQVS